MEKENFNKNQITNSDNFTKAVSFAVDKHSSQKRKGMPWPYIVHVYEVAQLLQESGADSDTVIAGVLHDTVEDTNTTLDEISEKF